MNNRLKELFIGNHKKHKLKKDASFHIRHKSDKLMVTSITSARVLFLNSYKKKQQQRIKYLEIKGLLNKKLVQMSLEAYRNYTKRYPKFCLQTF